MLSKIGPTKRTQTEDHFLDPKRGPENERPHCYWTKSQDQNREPKVAPILGLKNDSFRHSHQSTSWKSEMSGVSSSVAAGVSSRRGPSHNGRVTLNTTTLAASQSLSSSDISSNCDSQDLVAMMEQASFRNTRNTCWPVGE